MEDRERVKEAIQHAFTEGGLAKHFELLHVVWPLSFELFSEAHFRLVVVASGTFTPFGIGEFEWIPHKPDQLVYPFVCEMKDAMGAKRPYFTLESDGTVQ